MLSSDIVDHPLFHPLTDSTNRESPIRSSDLTAISFEPRLERGSYSWSQINYNEHLNASSSAVCPTFATFKSSSSSWRQNYAQKLDRSTSRSPILSISISKVLTSCTPLSNSPFDSIYAATSTLIPSRFILLFPFSRILRLLTQTVPPFSLFIEFFYFRMYFSQLMRPTRHRQSCLFFDHHCADVDDGSFWIDNRYDWHILRPSNRIIGKKPHTKNIARFQRRKKKK